MRRHDAIKIIVECLDDEYIVACNGMISRELFSIKDRAENFYMLGSMGLSSAIGLGAALARPDKKILVLAGDGNMLMALGTLATIGKALPKNLIHIVLDNECHESTGGQATVSSITKFDVIAYSAGFVNSKFVDNPNILTDALRTFLNSDGPSFINVKISKERIEAPRISIPPAQIKRRFMKSLVESHAL